MSDGNRQVGSKQNGISTQPLPASHKLYIRSQRTADVWVAMRAVHVSASGNGHQSNGEGEQANPPVMIYDTSGPYTEVNADTDIRRGLKPLRLEWIRSRGDVEELASSSYRPVNGKNNSHGAQTERFPDASRRP